MVGSYTSDWRALDAESIWRTELSSSVTRSICCSFDATRHRAEAYFPARPLSFAGGACFDEESSEESEGGCDGDEDALLLLSLLMPICVGEAERITNR